MWLALDRGARVAVLDGGVVRVIASEASSLREALQGERALRLLIPLRAGARSMGVLDVEDAGGLALTDPRERLLAALAYWLLLWQPLVAARERSRAAVTTLQQATTEASAQVSAILASRKLAAPRPVRSLFALIDSSAREAGLMSAQTRIEPLGEDRVRVSMDGVSFDQLAA